MITFHGRKNFQQAEGKENGKKLNGKTFPNTTFLFDFKCCRSKFEY